jgi:hypothetical protein
VKSSAVVCRVKVSADGQRVVSHAGLCMLREMAGTYSEPSIHAPCEMFADLTAAVANGADCVDGTAQLWTDHEQECLRKSREARDGLARRRGCAFGRLPGRPAGSRLPGAMCGPGGGYSARRRRRSDGTALLLLVVTCA